MRVTPLEIRQKSFDKKMRGYDKEAVDAFLLSLSHEWERLVDEGKQLKQQLESSLQEVKKLREVEESLFKTLKTAEDTGANLVDQANKSAELTLKEAQMNAEAILADARAQVKDMFDEADEHVKQVLSGLEGQARKIQDDLRSSENIRDIAVRDLKLLANEILEKTAKISDDKIEVSIPKKEIAKPQINNPSALVQDPLIQSTVEPIELEEVAEVETTQDTSDESLEINFEVNTNFEESKKMEGSSKTNITEEENKEDKPTNRGSFFDHLG